MSPSQRNRGTEKSSSLLQVTRLRRNKHEPRPVRARSRSPSLFAACTVPSAYQHTYTDTGGRMLGVMIHGATRNATVSVKMGVRGIPWAWERRDQEVLSGCSSLLSNK